MKPEKMTDERLAGITERFESGETMTPTEQRDVLAHIAALTAERDALARFKTYVHERCDAADVPTHPDGQHSKAGCRIGDRLDVLVGERDALRERVQALEAERDVARKVGTEQLGLRNVAERRLSAILQRAGDEGELVRVAQTAPALDRAAIRIHEEAVAVARYVVGEDTTRAAKAPLHCCGTTTDEHHETCPTRQALAPLLTPASPEPSTAEAFATVRTSLRRRPGFDAAAMAAISLLERRMGAMGRGLKECRSHAEWVPGCPRSKAEQLEEVQRAVCVSVARALTDAPPVFTLEEVERAISAATVPSHLEVSAELKRCIRENLAALCKVTP